MNPVATVGINNLKFIKKKINKKKKDFLNMIASVEKEGVRFLDKALW